MAKRFLVALAVVLDLATAGTALAAEPNPVVAATPPQPTWSALSREQQSVLAPLAGEWDRMENYRRKKWLGIADRYRTMVPEEQQRLQDRIRTWAKLTPEQRLAAREKYRQMKQMDPEKKAAVKQKWLEYKQLPEEEKDRLRAGKAAPGAASPTPNEK
ncbi:MAG TPA: DUF3106 domain-containing protein [Azospira sp.]|nr:DUF3106 domain-containing protein [Azospira sp.]